MEGMPPTIIQFQIADLMAQGTSTNTDDTGPVTADLLTRFTHCFGSDEVLNTAKIVMGFGVALIVADIFSTGGEISVTALEIGGGILAFGVVLRIMHFGVSLCAPNSETLQFFKDPFSPESIEIIKDSLKELSIYTLFMGLDAIFSELIGTMAVSNTTLKMAIPIIAVGASGLTGFLMHRVYKGCTDSSGQPSENTALIITDTNPSIQ